MEVIYLTSSIVKIKELLAILDPYADNWQCWIRSDACFLSEQDIDVICFFLMTGSHQMAVAELKITEWEAGRILNAAEIKLRNNYPLFKQWLVSSSEFEADETN